MTNETTALPPVYRDVITAEQAPANEKDMDKRVFKANMLRGARATELSDHINTQPSPDVFNQPIETQQNTVDYYVAIRQAEQAKKTASGLMAKLKGLPTSDEVQSKIAEVTILLDASEKELLRLQREQAAAGMYTPDYLRKQSDPARLAELDASTAHSGVPTVTEHMTSALKLQDTSQREIKREADARYESSHAIALICEKHGLHITNPEVDLPSNGCLHALEQRQKRDSAFSDRDLTLAIGTSIAMRVVTEKYCASHGFAFDRKRFDEYMQAGLMGFGHVGLQYDHPGKQKAERRADDFYKRYSGADSAPTLSFGVDAMAYLDEKFVKEPSDQDITPYTLAFITGIMLDGRMMLGNSIVHLLIASIPIEAKNGNKTRLGFGFTLNPNLRRGRNEPFTYTDAARRQTEYDSSRIETMPRSTENSISTLVEEARNMQGVNFQVLNSIQQAFNQTRS